MSAPDLRRIAVSAPGATCPMCGRPGDPTALFKDVYLCVTDGCRVWTFERARSSEEGQRASSASGLGEGRPP